MQRFGLALCLAFGLFGPGAALAQTQAALQPGQWQMDMTMTLPDQPPRNASRRVCLTPEDAVLSAGKMAASSQGQCQVRDFVAAGGRVSYTMVCGKPPQQMTGKYTGTYTRNRYELIGNTQAMGRNGKPLQMRFTTIGRFLGACPN
jgi:hypothetical protein